eukprot:GEMP01024396.1.p1 GENE.GEMP01024396.1~~GEMP01024396.1.p1  ORF type:complete len:552 (+),score=130.47 GEMP01024396.1:80-1735(+)
MKLLGDEEKNTTCSLPHQEKDQILQAARREAKEPSREAWGVNEEMENIAVFCLDVLRRECDRSAMEALLYILRGFSQESSDVILATMHGAGARLCEKDVFRVLMRCLSSFLAESRTNAGDVEARGLFLVRLMEFVHAYLVLQDDAASILLTPLPPSTRADYEIPTSCTFAEPEKNGHGVVAEENKGNTAAAPSTKTTSALSLLLSVHTDMECEWGITEPKRMADLTRVLLFCLQTTLTSGDGTMRLAEGPLGDDAVPFDEFLKLLEQAEKLREAYPGDRPLAIDEAISIIEARIAHYFQTHYIHDISKLVHATTKLDAHEAYIAFRAMQEGGRVPIRTRDSTPFEQHVWPILEEHGFLLLLKKLLLSTQNPNAICYELADTVTAVLWTILSAASETVVFDGVVKRFVESNGHLVALKLLNQNHMVASDSLPPAQEVSPCRTDAELTARVAHRLMEILYVVCKDSADDIRGILLFYKAPFILKRLYRGGNLSVRNSVTRLFRLMFPYLSRRWRSRNLDFITEIYLSEKMPLIFDEGPRAECGEDELPGKKTR